VKKNTLESFPKEIKKEAKRNAVGERQAERADWRGEGKDQDLNKSGAREHEGRQGLNEER